MSLEDELKIEHFKHLCDQTRHYNDKLTEAFTFHITTLSAIVGGSIWLSATKDHIDKSKFTVGTSLSNALVILLTLVTLVRVVGNFAAWYNIRNSQHAVLSDVPAPHWFGSSWLEAALALAVIAACAFFYVENPFTAFGAN